MNELKSCIKNLPKHIKTAVQNIWRNGVMSVSSIFAVTITLLLIGVISVLALNVQDITTNIEEGISIYVKLDRDLKSADEKKVGEEINKISGVKSAKYSSKDNELNKLIEKQGEDGADLFESYRKENPLGAAYEVEVTDSKNIEKVANSIEGIVGVNKVTYGGNSTRDMIDTLQTIRTGGTIFVAALVVVALFMIANTIKITITSRQTEIGIMRLVGASNWYIRIPFMLEGMLIGLIGAIIPIIVLIYGYNAVYSATNGMLVSAMLSLKPPYPFIRDFSLVLALLGSGVGLIGSYVSIRRFLKF